MMMKGGAAAQEGPPATGGSEIGGEFGVGKGNGEVGAGVGAEEGEFVVAGVAVVVVEGEPGGSFLFEESAGFVGGVVGDLSGEDGGESRGVGGPCIDEFLDAGLDEEESEFENDPSGFEIVDVSGVVVEIREGSCGEGHGRTHGRTVGAEDVEGELVDDDGGGGTKAEAPGRRRLLGDDGPVGAVVGMGQDFGEGFVRFVARPVLRPVRRGFQVRFRRLGSVEGG
mmetsp:Transcript_7180/g.18708  ORF Transcript_7180/g.18708 Transcript_7180/m.18708 type:complete len:225 (+) Transcript_7180:186-860(+)